MLQRFAVACFAIACLVACAARAQQARAQNPDNVCSYVADAFQTERMREITAESGELVRADGTKAKFTILDGGTAHVPYFASPDGDDLPDEFYVPEQLWSWDDLYIVPHGGRSYVVHADEGELKSVSEPNVGVTCQFITKAAPKLITNLVPAICKKLEEDDGSFFSEAPAQEVATPQPDDAAGFGGGPVTGGVVSTSSFDVQGKPVTVARYEYYSTAGSGCKDSGLFFVRDGKEEETPRNEALRTAQERVADCDTSTTTLVSMDGEVLLKLSGREGGRSGTHTRRLMKINGDQIEEICRVDELRSYTPF